MKLATLRTGHGTVAVRIDNGAAIEITGIDDVGALLLNTDWERTASAASGFAWGLSKIDPSSWAAVIPAPSKVVCVGLNYRSHILEMGRQLPEYPTLFAKYPEALIGPNDPILLPEYASRAVDWEGELAIIVGKTARKLDAGAAEKAIAGYSILNDVTMRDYQYRTPEWFQGKTFENSTPFGPVLVTPDEYQIGSEIRTEVDGEIVQHSTTNDLVFDPASLVSYISHIVTLNPGDVIASGTPGGVGHARNPARYLSPGSTLTTTIQGIGTLTNVLLLED